MYSGLTAQLFGSIDGATAVEQLTQLVAGCLCQLFFCQLGKNPFGPNLVPLVQCDADAVHLLIRHADGVQHTLKHPTVVDLDGEGADVQSSAERRGGVNQLQLAQRRIAAEDVDVTLDKFAHSALLRTLGAVGFVNLDTFKWVRQLGTVARIKAAERRVRS